MAGERELIFSDVKRAAERRDPELANLIVRYLELRDPPEYKPEEGLAPGERTVSLEDAWTLTKLKRAIHPDRMRRLDPREAHTTRIAAWSSLMSAQYPPPRLRLGLLLVELYEAGDEPAHAALMDVFRRGRVCWGFWQGFKRVYKLAEERHDAAMFGVLAWRLDAMSQTQTARGEVSSATFKYMKRRAWRYLRHLGQAIPEIFPAFAVQVLRHYPASHTFYDSWVASQIWARQDLLWSTSSWMEGPPEDITRRAFNDSWKLSPEPLLRLIEDANNDKVCDFAIRGLKEDFPDALREVAPEWLARIGAKPLVAIHDFVVGVLTDSPEFHQAKLKDLGLHDMVLGWLSSDWAAARAYALDYARAHAPDIPVPDLVELLRDGSKEVVEFVANRLGERTASELGAATLIALIGQRITRKMAVQKFGSILKAPDITEEQFLLLAMGNSEQQKFVKEFYKQANTKVPAKYYIALLAHPGCSWSHRREAMAELATRTGSEIGIEWIKEAMIDQQLAGDVGEWLTRGLFKGEDLDVEWVKGMVMRPSLRSTALEILGNRELVQAHRVGLRWLLALARQVDETLQTFAQRYLLEHFAPSDFAADAGSDDVAVGIRRLWSLAVGSDEPESVRSFAGLYLKFHHPDLSQALPEARALGVKPRLGHDAYGLEVVRPLLFDNRADVRKLAAAIADVELVRWGDKDLLYELAASKHRIGRALASDKLLQIGKPGADPQRIPGEDWLDAARSFALAESHIKATREISLSLIRRHYERLGGARRLAWLMESPHREVRLFAVRLLWDMHRPLAIPTNWEPKRGEAPVAVSGDRFDSVEALRQFMRTVLFGLPPGRMERREGGKGGELPDRPLPASVAKQRLLEVVRDMALEDLAFTNVVLPVLEEFMNSEAMGEWHSCVAALAQIRHRHPSVETVLPAGSLSGGHSG